MWKNHIQNQICIKLELKKYYLFAVKIRSKMRNGLEFSSNQSILYQGFELPSPKLAKTPSLRTIAILKIASRNRKFEKNL